MHKPSILSQIVLCGQRMFTGSWRTFASTGMSCFRTLNSAKHSVSSMFSRSNLAYELCGKSGFLERQLSHKTKNSSSEIILLSYASNSIPLVWRKDIFKVFSSFRGRFRMGYRRKNTLCLSLDFGANDGTLLPRLTRLETSPSPQKRLVLKFPNNSRPAVLSGGILLPHPLQLVVQFHSHCHHRHHSPY